MSGLTARKAIWCGIFLSFLTLGVGFSASAARADDQSQPGVARISIVQGNVDVKRGDSGDTVAAAVNAPVMVGDYISTDGAARAEVQFDDANFLRIGYGTQLRLTKLDQNDNSLQLAQGTVELRVFAMDGANPSIETPSVTVTPSEPGQYVVSVTSDGNTQVTVRSGSASVADDQGTQTVMPGNTMIATGDPSNASFQDVSVIADVSFDGWTDQLDAQVAQADAPGYVNSGVVGANDLNDYGQWVDVPTYGEVWQPTEDSGWAPYTDGRWVWEPYYGYTWVSYEPWGWAPYHYGNWFYASDYGWCWYPGSVYERPVWRPAMVAFFGYGSGDFDISVGFGYGDIGWVPVAPFEPFYPWWGGNSVTVVNVTNIYNITNVYSNFGRGGYVVVHARDFADGDFSHHVAIEPRAIGNVHLVTGTVPIVPTRSDLIVARSGGFRPDPIVENRKFAGFAAPEHIASFQDERSHVEIAASRPVTVPFEQRFPSAVGGTDSAPTYAQRYPTQVAHADTAPSQNGGSVWQRFGFDRPAGTTPVQPRPQDLQPAPAPVDRDDAVVPRSQSDPWARFGSSAPRYESTVRTEPVDRTPDVPERTMTMPHEQTAPPSGFERFGSQPQSTYRPAQPSVSTGYGYGYGRPAMPVRPAQAPSYYRTFAPSYAARPSYARPSYARPSYARPAAPPAQRPRKPQ